MLEVISMVEDIADRSLDIEVAGDGKGDVRRTAADTSRARYAWDGGPAPTLIEGLLPQLAWVQARSAHHGRALT